MINKLKIAIAKAVSVKISKDFAPRQTNIKEIQQLEQSCDTDTQDIGVSFDTPNACYFSTGLLLYKYTVLLFKKNEYYFIN